MNYRISFASLGAAVAIALLLPTQSRANALTSQEDADGPPSALTTGEPLPAPEPDGLPDGLPDVGLEAGITAEMAELRPADLDLIPAGEMAEMADPMADPGGAGMAALEWLFSGNTSLNAGYQINSVKYSGDG